MTKQVVNYLSFLLRLWRDDEKSEWRVSLEDPHTSEFYGFASPAQLYKFLEQQMDRQSGGDINSSSHQEKTDD